MKNTCQDNLLSKSAIVDMGYSHTEKLNCVYFLIYKDEILYIGSTKDFRSRLRMHASNSQIFFTSVYTIEVEERLGRGRKQLERKYVEKFSPKFNKQWNEDFLSGKNKLWYNYITHFNSYRELGKICGVDEGVARSVVNNLRKAKDEKYYKVYDKVMSMHSTQEYYESLRKGIRKI